MKKRTLKDVTLFLYDGGDSVDQSVRTVNHCAKLLPFGDVMMFLHKRPSITTPHEWHIMPDTTYPDGKGKFFGLLPFLFFTSHILMIQNDGYITNPGLWNDDWLKYDYVAPPWPKSFTFTKRNGKYHQVGCGGFCLKSHKFCWEAGRLWTRYDCRENCDMFECQTHAEELYSNGIRFAPVDEALKFGIEYPIEEHPGWRDDQSFGFHDIKNVNHLHNRQRKLVT